MSLSRHAGWLVPSLITLVAALVRLVGLGHPHDLVFDETYYVKDSWSLLHLGYEGTWPEGANPGFLQGQTNTFTDVGSFVVHPPLGKWIIAAGMALFGADSAIGWRIAIALAGIAMVPVLYLLARRISGSGSVAAVAAGLLAIDPLGVTMSRVALLDGLVALFVLLGFWFLVRDDPFARVRDDDTVLGGSIMVRRRGWLIAAGAAFGAATAVKWSGLYVIAGVGIGLVVLDAWRRRRARMHDWHLNALVRQGPVTFVLFVFPALVVYLASWMGWFVTAGGYDRASSPNPLVAFWNYQQAVYAFHVGLSTSHPYASPAWQWPLLLRPTAMWVDRPEVGSGQCLGSTDCIAVITSIPNPVAWWAGMLAVLACVVLAWRTRHAALLLPAAGIAVTYGPWLLYPERTIFQFYTIVMLPYSLLALALVIGYLNRARRPILLPDPTPEERASANAHARRSTSTWRMVTGVFLAIIALVGLFYLPLSWGISLPWPLWQAHNWLTSWV